MEKKLIFLLITAFLSGCSSDPTGNPAAPRNLSSYFQVMPVADMLRFEITDEDALVQGDTIPNGLFFSSFETRLMNGLEYFDNSGELKVIGRFRFPLTDSMEAYVVDLQQNWYRHESLFLFDKSDSTFTQRVTVAEFFGGDGGQVLGGSWLIDFNGDGQKDIIRRSIEHWLVLEGEETRDTTAENGWLLAWESDRFTEMPSDSLELIKRFPIKSYW